ncbi:hypothetical protein ACWGID_40690 [Kribbella sp. NPDC054772]
MSDSGDGYSSCGASSTTHSADGETKTELPRAYAYARKHLLMCESEVNRTKERLTYFAKQAGYNLSAVFVEEVQTAPDAFERLVQAVVNDKVETVILPSMLHFAVLGDPKRIREHFEGATGAKVVIAVDVVSYNTGEAVS